MQKEEKMLEVIVGNIFVFLEYAVFVKDALLAMSCFHDSEMSVKGACAKIGLAGEPVRIMEEGKLLVSSLTNMDLEHYHTCVRAGRTNVYQSVSLSKGINKEYLFINETNMQEELYAYLMNQFTYPLLREWVEYIWNRACELELMKYADFQVYGETELFQNVRLVRTILNEDDLKKIVSEGLQTGKIFIVEGKQNKLEFTDMDDYFAKYGHTLVQNLEDLLQPLTPIREIVDELAFLKKSPFPQQAAIINGAVACLNKKNYAFLIESMGAGKTLQGMGIAEAYFNQKYLKSHPGVTIEDIYKDGTLVKYRVIVMCPSHLVKKWATSIMEEIPYARAIILDSLEQLIELKKQGKTPTGKTFYIMSKDTGKLSYSYRPVPHQVKKKPLKIAVCRDCGTEFPVDKSQGCACGCYQWKWKSFEVVEEGMVCPECGEILLPVDGRNLFDTNIGRYRTLKPEDFAVQNSSNLFCRHCGTSLWTVASKPLDTRILFRKPKMKKSKWRRISHYTNRAMKVRKTVWVYRDSEDEYLKQNGVTESEIQEMDFYGPRKFGLTRYIKKYLKGYFGFAIFDEVQEYKAGGSAQGLAMHDLVKACPKHLALTGTIAGGYASDLFYTLFRLDPVRMKSKGYTYGSSGERKFVTKYGTMGTTYELSEDPVRHKMTRGRVITPQHCLPGISVLVFTDFLLDSALFLDLSDLSRFLPPLYEYVEVVPLETQIQGEYDSVRTIMKESMKNGEKAILGSFLQFSLSYTDKPYGCAPILSPQTGDCVVTPKDMEYLIEEDRLLNKEAKLVELVNAERKEKRNVFVYCEFTGNVDSITYRLRHVLQKHCSLRDGEVVVLESASPPAVKREEWMHQKASEGVTIFITNAKCVATGLDFAFDFCGKHYNYPTIIFYQTGYDMIKIWQASRRHYRLNQTLECRTYFLCSANTIQLDVIEMIATKEVATSAIQGQFSSEGLSTMARGIDPRVVLASAVAEKSEQKEKGLRQMMDVINMRNNQNKGNISYVKMKTFYELTGYESVPNIDEEMEMLTDEELFELMGWNDEQVQSMVEVTTISNIYEEESKEIVVETKEHRLETGASPNEEIDDFLKFILMWD